MKKVKHPLITFIIVFVVLIAVYATVGMYPFGDRQVMIIDSWHQYFPFFKELSMRLREGRSVFYSWDTGLGTNFFALIAYYALSSLNLLSIFVPEEYLREFFYLGIIIKTALGGAFFTIYIRGIHKRDDFSTVLFGLMYAFSAFFINYYWNTMWLDCAALLPLIMLGMHKLIDEGKYLLYILSFSIALISNFYIGYFLCEFIALYYFVVYFTKRDKVETKDFFKNLGKIILSSIVALAIASVVLVPVYFAMKNAYGLQSYNPKKPEVYYTIFEIISNLFIYAKPTVVDGMPNIYSSILALALVMLYFFSSAKKKNKIINGVFIAFLLLSFNINYLNFAWHGFHFPNQVPYRFSFVFSFVLISLAYEAYLDLANINKARFMQVFLGAMALILILEQAKSDKTSFISYYMTIVVLAAYLLILGYHKKDKIKEDVFLKMAILLVISEGIFLASLAFMEGGSSGRDDYYPELNEVNECISYIEKDPEFCRAELVKRFVTNDSIHYGYRGIAQFSSAANSHVSELTRNIGMPSDAGSNTIGYSATSPAVNGMLAVKYIMSKNDFVPLPNAQYELVKETGNVDLLENKYFLPLGYMVNEDIVKLEFAYHKPLYNQEDFYSYATGLDLDLYEKVEPINDAYTNMEISSVHNGKYNYKNINASAEGNGFVEYEIGEPGQYYLYFLNQNQKLEVAKNGSSKRYKARRGVIADLGICEIGDAIRADFDVDAQPSGYFEIQLVRLNEENFAKIVDVLRREKLEVVDYGDDYLKAKIDVKDSGLLYTSIPYEKGFKILVDGKETKAKVFNDAFITLPLSVGEHNIEFRYMPYGLYYGAIISFLALFLLLLFTLIMVIINIKRKKAKVKSENLAAIMSDKSEEDRKEEDRKEEDKKDNSDLEKSEEEIKEFMDKENI